MSELMPAPRIRMVSSPESTTVTPPKETLILPEKGEHYSNHFLGTLLTPDLNPDAKITTLLSKPTAAYKAIDLLWSDQRETVAADQHAQKVKEWADARAETQLDMLLAPREDMFLPKNIFADTLGFTFDQTLPRAEQVAKFSEYLQGPFYEKYCGINGLQNLAEALSTIDVRGLHDFLAPILGGEDQYQRLEACQLALYRNSGRSSHPLSLEAVNSETLSSEEAKLLDPMRKRLSKSSPRSEYQDNAESTPIIPSENLTLLEDGKSYPLNEIFAYLTSGKVESSVEAGTGQVVSIEDALLDKDLMEAMIERRPLPVTLSNEQGQVYNNPEVLSLTETAKNYGSTIAEHSRFYLSGVNSLLAVSSEHPEMMSQFIDTQKQINEKGVSPEQKYVLQQIILAGNFFEKEHVEGFALPPSQALISYNELRKNLGILQQVNKEAGKLTTTGTLPEDAKDLLQAEELSENLLKKLKLDGTIFTKEYYAQLLTYYPTLVGNWKIVAPYIHAAVEETRNPENKQFQFALRIAEDLSVEIDKDLTLQQVIPAHIKALQEASASGQFVFGQDDEFAEMLSDIYTIEPVFKKLKHNIAPPATTDLLQQTIAASDSDINTPSQDAVLAKEPSSTEKENVTTQQEQTRIPVGKRIRAVLSTINQDPGTYPTPFGVYRGNQTKDERPWIQRQLYPRRLYMWRQAWKTGKVVNIEKTNASST